MAAFFNDYEVIRKSGLFDPKYYLSAYPEVAERGTDPLVHYLEEGAWQGHNPHPNFDADFYLRQCRAQGEEPQNPLLHFLQIGEARGFKTCPDEVPTDRDAATTLSPTAESGALPILVAVESLGVAATPEGGVRVSINGWALASSPITEITAATADRLVGTAVYGLDRPDIAVLHPDREGACRSGFILAFELPRQSAPAIEVVLGVRTRDGEVGRRALRVEIPPKEVDVGIVDPLIEPKFEPVAPSRAPMQLHVDRVAVDTSGVLHLEGWVVCLVQIQSVEAYVGDQRIGQAEFGRVRDDVEAVWPDYPNARFSGFVLDGSVAEHGPGGRTILVRAVARTGISREVSAEVEIPEIATPEASGDQDAFHYHCDEITLTTAGRVVLKGWAVCATPVTTIKVQLDGEEIGEAELAIERPDVGNHFAAFPHARQSGFSFQCSLGQRLEGEHLLTLRIGQAGGYGKIVELPVLAAEATEGELGGAVTVGDDERKLHIDIPLVIGGAMETVVRGNLEISGWALARGGVAAIEIGLDGTPIATADHGIRRLDIQAAFPDWEDALGSGFLVLLPHRVLTVGGHTVSIRLRDKGGKTVTTEFRIEVEELSDSDGPWALRRKIPPAELALHLEVLQRRGWRPCFAAVLPLGDDADEIAKARRTIVSLQGQAYPHWRLLILAQDADTQPRELRSALTAGFDEVAERIEIVRKIDAADIAGAAAPEAGKSDWFATVLTAGDELGCDAFLELALLTATYGGTDFVYSEERRRNPATNAVDAFFKPQWSPDLLLSMNYIGRLWCARGDLLTRVLASNETFLARGEYDLVLRCTEAAQDIRRLPNVLCECAERPADSAAEDRAALEEALVRRGIAGEIHPNALPGTYRLKRSVATTGLVSIIIPTRATRGMIKTCIETLRQLTAYRNYEIVCIENIPPEDADWRDWLRVNADWVVSTEEPFNWSRFNNLAAEQASGDFLLFLNDDIEIVEPDWLDTLLEHAQRPEVGVVGPRLLYPDRRVQHAGMFLAALGQGRHAFRYAKEDDPVYFGLARTTRNVIAVTGACLMVRRSTFDALGQFDEAHGVINNDLDFCLRAWESGLVNIFTPHGSLIHHEAVSRGGLEDTYDAAVFESRWRSLFLAGDPYFNPNLSKSRDDLSIDAEPTRLLYAGRPAVIREQIRKILAVKLDHIGDCIIAFPAIRRLKRHFPDARIEVLTSRSSKSVWAMEPAIEAVHEFDFFHPRSSGGQLEVSEAQYEALRERLVLERFDLAVDFRKHPETRPVLQYTGARYLAGFDHRDRFSWLDVGLDWSGDQAFARKRQHTADDLINLVDAIAAACEADRTLVAVRPKGGVALERLDLNVSADRPLVCVHPTAGNEMKQWPVEFFAAVIDQLVEEDGAHVVLIGAPGEEVTAERIIERIRQPVAVTSLVGKLPLGELPGLLVRASLFLGNDSGPKHIAAGLGVPTVGVHSGTVDPREWGPVGPRAVAVAREVVCTPCYLSVLEDCHRGLACMRQLAPEMVYRACKRLLMLNVGAGPEQPVKPARPTARRRGRGAAHVKRADTALQVAGE